MSYYINTHSQAACR